MKHFALATAAALALSAGAASAYEFSNYDHRATFSYGGFEKDDITLRGPSYQLEGHFGALNYEGTVFDGDLEDLDAKSANAKVSYLMGGFGGFGVGPAVQYDYASLSGVSDDEWTVGLAAKGAVGQTLVKADVLSSTEDFGDNWAASVELERGFSDSLVGTLDYAYVDYGDESHTLALGARYDLTQTTYVEGNVSAERSFGETGKGAAVGVGFRF